MMKIAKIGFLALLCLSAACLHAQEIRQNEKGEKILVFPDGSWQFFDDFMNGNTTANAPEQTATPYPTYKADVEPLDGEVAVTQEDVFRIAVRRSQLASQAAGIARKRAEKAKEARESLEKEWTDSQKSGKSSTFELKQIKNRVMAARQAEQDATLEAREAIREADKARQLTEKGMYVSDYNAQLKEQKQQAATDQSQSASVDRPYESVLPLTDNWAALGRKNNDLILNPPAAACITAFEGTDEATGQLRKDLQKQFLFTHTDERLRPFLKDKPYLRCEGYFSAVGGYRFLTLEFTFAYPNAREAYGFIEKGSVLTIKLLNGDFVNLRSGTMDQGRYDIDRDLLTYRVYYPVSRGQMNLLRQTEVDAIRVFWSSGYEEYEVYQLDFFINQIGCIN